MNLKSKSAWLSGLAVTAVLIGATPAVGQVQPDAGQAGIVVQPNPAAGNVPVEMLAALQRDLKVSAEQARARLVRSDWASRLDPLLRQRLGGSFGGSWLAEDGLEYVVAITDPKLAAVVRASGATPRLVARSETQLLGVGDRLRAQGEKHFPAELGGWVIDPQSNGLRVRYLPGGRAAVEEFVAAAGLIGQVSVSYEEVAALPAPTADVKGGDQYWLDPAGFDFCSVGFAVTFNLAPGATRAGYLTAGHCATGPGTWAKSPNVFGQLELVEQGRFVRARTGLEHDEAIVETKFGFTPRPVINTYHRPGAMIDQPITDGNPQIDGSVACTSGARTLMKCGRIKPGFWFGPPGAAATLNLKALDYCIFPGDSGGAVFAGSHAQGIAVSSSSITLTHPDGSRETRCQNFSNNETFYVPLQRALDALGATLQTRQVSTTPPPQVSSKWAESGSFWDGLGGAVRGRVASVSLDPGRVQVFGRGTDNQLYTKTSVDGMWGAWQGLGEFLTEPPTVLARSGGIDVYFRGGDTRPYLKRFNGSGWEAPVRLGELDVQGPIFALSPQPGHVILFARGSDDEVYFNFTDGVAPWSGWSSLDGDTNDAPTAIARTNAAGQIVIEVYARWADDNVRYRRLDPAGPPGWQPWQNLGGVFNGTPVAVTVGPNHSWLIGWNRTDNTASVQRFKDGAWLPGWRGVGGNVASPLTAVAGPGQQIRVFARDANQRINMIAWTGNDIFWENWTPTLLGDTTTPIGVSMRSNGQLGVIDAFGIDAATSQAFHTVINGVSATAEVAVHDTALHVGDDAYYTAYGPPGAPVSWSSTKDGVTVEDHAFYGDRLDANGLLTVNAGPWTGSATGSWVKKVHIGTQNPQTAQVAYTVNNRLTSIFTDRGRYLPGENITFAVTGPANQPISAASWINGLPSGTSPPVNGGQTDANGMFTITVPWTDPRPGFWKIQINVAGQPAEVIFAVSNAPVSIFTESTLYGFGSFIYYMVAGPPDQPTFWTTWINGVLRSSNVPGPPTDADGLLITEPSPWINFSNGTYVVQVGIGSQTAQVTFVFNWPQPPIVNPWITVEHSNKCLDVEGHTVNDGARVIQSDCVTGVNSWSNTETARIAEHSGKCLEVAGTQAGAHTYQWTCNGGPLQRWHGVNATPEGWRNLYHIVSTTTGMCLTVANASLAHGAAVVQMPCTGAANQIWYIGNPIIVSGPAESIPV